MNPSIFQRGMIKFWNNALFNHDKRYSCLIFITLELRQANFIIIISLYIQCPQLTLLIILSS